MPENEHPVQEEEFVPLTPDTAPDAFRCSECGAGPGEPCDPQSCPSYNKHREEDGN